MLLFQDTHEMWEGEDGSFERVFFTLDKGEFAGRRFEVEFEVCPDPTCPCTVVHWLVQEDVGGDVTSEGFHFAVDIEQKSCETGEGYEEPSLRFGAAVLTELSAEDWTEIEDIFYSSKAELSDEFDPAEATWPFDSEVLEEEPVFPYGEVFPFAEPLLFTGEKGVEMVAFDGYDAVDPAPLAYLAIYQADIAEEEMTEENAINLTLDYGRKSLAPSPGRPRGGDSQKLLQALERDAEELWTLLKKRHQNLRLVYEKRQ